MVYHSYTPTGHFDLNFWAQSLIMIIGGLSMTPVNKRRHVMRPVYLLYAILRFLIRMHVHVLNITIHRCSAMGRVVYMKSIIVVINIRFALAIHYHCTNID